MHKSVLLKQTIEALELAPSKTAFDGTLGNLGHAKEIVKRIEGGVFIGTDLDPEAVKKAEKELDFDGKVILKNTSFSRIDEICKEEGIEKIDAVLLDLGWSADQLFEGANLSFDSEEELNMRYDRKSKDEALTAYDVVNSWSEQVLADIFYGLAGERRAKKIAREIVRIREEAPIMTNKELAEIVRKVYRFWGKTNPATKVFQAIRIVVNDELAELERFFENVLPFLSSGARVAVISFHSVEDRIVKNTFRTWEKQAFGEVLTKKPIVAGQEELKQNKRARSAKLRVFKKS